MLVAMPRVAPETMKMGNLSALRQPNQPIFRTGGSVRCADNLESNWTIGDILSRLPGYRRVDDGGDLLAFRITGFHGRRAAYVYLWGENPDLIHYDLEDPSVGSGEWDHAVGRGSLRSVEELDAVLRAFLRPGA